MATIEEDPFEIDELFEIGEVQDTVYYDGKLITKSDYVRDYLKEEILHRANASISTYPGGLSEGLGNLSIEKNGSTWIVNCDPGVVFDGYGRRIGITLGSNPVSPVLDPDSIDDDSIDDDTRFGLFVESDNTFISAPGLSIGISGASEKECQPIFRKRGYRFFFDRLSDVIINSTSEFDETNPDDFVKNFYDKYLSKGRQNKNTLSKVLVEVLVKKDGRIIPDTSKQHMRSIIYNNQLLFHLISSHIQNDENPHKIDAKHIQAVRSINGIKPEFLKNNGDVVLKSDFITFKSKNDFPDDNTFHSNHLYLMPEQIVRTGQINVEFDNAKSEIVYGPVEIVLPENLQSFQYLDKPIPKVEVFFTNSSYQRASVLGDHPSLNPPYHAVIHNISLSNFTLAITKTDSTLTTGKPKLYLQYYVTYPLHDVQPEQNDEPLNVISFSTDTGPREIDAPDPEVTSRVEVNSNTIPFGESIDIMIIDPASNDIEEIDPASTDLSNNYVEIKIQSTVSGTEKTVNAILEADGNYHYKPIIVKTGSTGPTDEIVANPGEIIRVFYPKDDSPKQEILVYPELSLHTLELRTQNDSLDLEIFDHSASFQPRDLTIFWDGGIGHNVPSNYGSTNNEKTKYSLNYEQIKEILGLTNELEPGKTIGIEYKFGITQKNNQIPTMRGSLSSQVAIPRIRVYKEQTPYYPLLISDGVRCSIKNTLEVRISEPKATESLNRSMNVERKLWYEKDADWIEIGTLSEPNRLMGRNVYDDEKIIRRYKIAHNESEFYDDHTLVNNIRDIMLPDDNMGRGRRRNVRFVTNTELLKTALRSELLAITYNYELIDRPGVWIESQKIRIKD